MKGYLNNTETYENIARTCHEANRAFCVSQGDTTQPHWEDAPEWQKESARAGVRLHLHSYASVEQSHESWMKQKVDDGWVYGETKDAEKKTHPCIVPYEKLPSEQRFKDYLFRSIVHEYKEFIMAEYT